MTTWRTTRILTLALALLALGGAASDAAADLRVRASLDTPHLRIDLDDRGLRVLSPGPRVAPGCGVDLHVDLRPRDRRAARRLGRLLGVPARELLAHRSHGYTWREIGRAYGLSRRAVRAALSGEGWTRYLRYAADRSVGCDVHDADDRRGGRRGGGRKMKGDRLRGACR